MLGVNDIYQAILDGKLQLTYAEDENMEPRIEIYGDEGIVELVDEGMVAKIMMIASFAGFEPPTEIYKLIDAYLQADGDGEL